MYLKSKISLSNESNNNFGQVLVPLNQRKDFNSGNHSIIPVYFSIYLGVQKSEHQYTSQISSLLNRLNSARVPFLVFKETLPITKNDTLTHCIQSVFKKIQNKALKSPSLIFDELKNFKEISKYEPYFPHILDILNIYLKDNSNISETQLKNFLTKLFIWFDTLAMEHAEDLLNNLNASKYENPVIIYFGNIKTHSEYFLYLCSLVGFDVLFIHPDNSFITKFLKKIGQEFRFDQSSLNMKFPDFIKASKTESSPPPSLPIEIADTTNIPAIIKYKSSENVYNDFATKISDRSGFIRGTTPFLPVYFYRIIGIHSDYNHYFNELFRFDRKLKAKHTHYLRFDGHIPSENDIEYIKSFSSVWKEYQNSNMTQLDKLFKNLGNIRNFPNSEDPVKKDMILAALHSTVLEFVADSSITSVGQIKNFVMKLLIWTNQHLSNSFSLFDFENLSAQETDNPKILYYGSIKKHEAYFLLFSSRLGIDVVFLNTYEDSVLGNILTDELKDYKIQLKEKCRMQPFPTKEILERTETVAYQASKEIESVIFNPEDGLYKPWQLDPFKIKPVSLQSTLDEAKTLWPIEARLRDKFEVKEDTVYLPNLFFKLNGLPTNEDDYWQLIAGFNNNQLVKLVDKLPFTLSTFSKTDEYLVDYIMNSKGLLDLKEVKKKQIYKYKHLKDSTQNLILVKINEVLSSKAYAKPIDKKTKRVIILTLLNLDNDILNLIASFDKPFAIPKLIIFDPDESMFSKEDIAIIMFLHLIGFDIGIFTPTGYNNIENEINKNYFDIYRLENVAFNLTLPDLNTLKSATQKGKSFFSSLFKL